MELANQNLQKELEEEEKKETKEKVKAKIQPKEYDYLLNMNLWSLSLEKVEELMKQKEIKEVELNALIKTEIATLWNNDLDNFIEELDKYEKQEEEDRLLAEKKKKVKNNGTKKQMPRRRKIDKNNKSSTKIEESERGKNKPKNKKKNSENSINIDKKKTNIINDDEEEKEKTNKKREQKQPKKKDSLEKLENENKKITDVFEVPLFERLKAKNQGLGQGALPQLDINYNGKDKRKGDNIFDDIDFEL